MYISGLDDLNRDIHITLEYSSLVKGIKDTAAPSRTSEEQPRYIRGERDHQNDKSLSQILPRSLTGFSPRD